MKEYKLYNGKIILQFDPKEHIYLLDGQNVKNMTSITGIITNKDAMVNWAAKRCKLKFLEMMLPNTSYSLKELDGIAK